MKRVFIVMVLMINTLSPVFATKLFSYRGVFPDNRDTGAKISNYIFLKKDSEISFDIREASGKVSDRVIVSGIKLTSNPDISFNRSQGLTSIQLTETGIYEVTLVPHPDSIGEISFILRVSELEQKEVALGSKNIAKLPDSKLNIPTTSDKEEKIHTLDGTDELTTTDHIVENLSTSLLSSATIATDNNDPFNDINHVKASFIETLNPNEKEQQTSFYSEAASLTVHAPAIDSGIINAPEPDVLVASLNDFVIAPFTPRISLSHSARFIFKKSIKPYESERENLRAWLQSITWDENGSLWLLDSQLRRLVNMNIKGEKRISFSVYGNQSTNLGLPVAMLQTGSQIFVADTLKHAIHIFDKNGIFAFSITSRDTTAIDIPSGMCVRNNEIWATDRGSARILCFNQQGEFLGSFGSTEEVMIDSPVGIRADKSHLFILEKGGLVKKFSPMGKFDATFQSNCINSAGFDTDPWEGIWICDANESRIVRFSYSGAVLTEIKSPPLPKTWYPTSVSVRIDGTVAVSDSENKMIHFFIPAE